MSRCHVAIIDPAYVGPIVLGIKTVEARLTRTRRAPYRSVAPGDEVFFRARGDGYAARAVVVRVHEFAGLDAPGVRRLEAQFGPRVLGPDSFWKSRLDARYATMIELARPRPTAIGPDLARRPGDRRAWFVIGSGHADAIAA